MTPAWRLAAAALAIAAPAAARPPAADPASVAAVRAGRRTTANAAWWGFDPVNATACLQAAIRSGARRVIVPAMGSDWIVDPVQLESDQEVVFEKSVVVTARPGGYPGSNDSLISAIGKRNITLRGYGATLRMQKPEYTTGEWRMALRLESCTHVRVLGLTVRDSGGDGIYIGGSGPGQPYCRDIVVRDCIADNNRRQGMSVISAHDLLVERCVFRNTTGTSPSAGVDLEPDQPSERLINCVFRDCRMENNEGPGFVVSTATLNETSEPVTVRFERCHVRGARNVGIWLGKTRAAGPKGLIEVTDCTVRDTQDAGVSIRRKSVDAMRIRFTRCSWRDVARQDATTPPILLFAWINRPIGVLGGIEFVDCAVDDDRDRPFLAVVPADAGGTIADIRGSFSVRNPTGVRTSLSPNGIGVFITTARR